MCLSPGAMNRDQHPGPELLEAALDRLPLFPLPNAILFPGVVMPLHLFEPRYRALAEHCVAGHRLMALGTLKPGYEQDYEGRPPIHPLLTVGSIAAERRHPDGRWDIALRGLMRVELVDEHPASEPFRVIRVKKIREQERATDRLAGENLRSAVIQVANQVPALWPQLSPQLVSARSPGQLADVVAGTFVESPTIRRSLLEELVVGRRIELLQESMAQILLDLALRARSDSERPREPLN
jgi:Lon protease-like protein